MSDLILKKNHRYLCLYTYTYIYIYKKKDFTSICKLVSRIFNPPLREKKNNASEKRKMRSELTKKGIGNRVLQRKIENRIIEMI